MDPKHTEKKRQFRADEIGAIAHLYRGEIYRSTIWRTRLDNTTNWSVVTLGIALSAAYSSREASPLPLVLVGMLILFFLLLETRRYRYFSVWRARARWLETHFYAPMLETGDLHDHEDWQEVLANDYRRPKYHVSFLRALGRRLRSSYLWLLLIQTIAYFGKLMVHPAAISSLDELWQRAAIGPVAGEYIIVVGILYNATAIAIVIYTWRLDRAHHHHRGAVPGMG